MNMAISNSKIERLYWYIHNLDILAGKYKIIVIDNELDSEDNNNGS